MGSFYALVVVVLVVVVLLLLAAGRGVAGEARLALPGVAGTDRRGIRGEGPTRDLVRWVRRLRMQRVVGLAGR